MRTGSAPVGPGCNPEQLVKCELHAGNFGLRWWSGTWGCPLAPAAAGNLPPPLQASWCFTDAIQPPATIMGPALKFPGPHAARHPRRRVRRAPPSAVRRRGCGRSAGRLPLVDVPRRRLGRSCTWSTSFTARQSGQQVSAGARRRRRVCGARRQAQNRRCLISHTSSPDEIPGRPCGQHRQLPAPHALSSSGASSAAGPCRRLAPHPGSNPARALRPPAPGLKAACAARASPGCRHRNCCPPWAAHRLPGRLPALHFSGGMGVRVRLAALSALGAPSL